MNTWSTRIPLFKVTVLGTVSPHVTRVPTLKTAPVLRLPLLLFDVVIFVVFFLLHPGRKSYVVSKNDKQKSILMSKKHHRGDCAALLIASRLFCSFVAQRRGQPAPLGTVLHVMSDLPADPAAPVVRGQLAVCQHL